MDITLANCKLISSQDLIISIAFQEYFFAQPYLKFALMLNQASFGDKKFNYILNMVQYLIFILHDLKSMQIGNLLSIGTIDFLEIMKSGRTLLNSFPDCLQNMPLFLMASMDT